MLQEEKWLTSWWLTRLTIMGMFVSHCFYLCQITAWPLHKCTNLISPLRHRPTKAIREDYARGIVMLFPSLKDPYSKKGYVIGIIIVNSFMSCCDTKLCGRHWYLNSVRFLMSLVWQRISFIFFISGTLLWCCTGYISWRLKTVQRKIRRGSALPPNSPIDFSPGGPNFQRTVNVERQLDGDACQEAMSLLNHTTDNSLIFQKMRETFQHRQKLVNDPGRSVDILSSFPRFLDTKGLVSLGWDV